MTLTEDELCELALTHFADDINIPVGATEWSIEEAEQFFESGGSWIPVRRARSCECTVITLAHRNDRRSRFLQHWCGTPPRFALAIDGRTLINRVDVPLEASVSAGVRRLLSHWRHSMCTHEKSWGTQQPRKLAAVAACHCSHLLLWDALVQSGDNDRVLFVMEDDATLQLPAHTSYLPDWFSKHVSPQLPADWALVYLNEPVKFIDERRLSGPSSDGILPATPNGWRIICADNIDHPAAQCVREIDGVPTTEAYALRRSAAKRLIEFSLVHGLGAVDYVIAKAFASAAALAMASERNPDLRGVIESSGNDAEGEGTQLPMGAGMAQRVFLVDPPVACQSNGSADSDIQNFVLFNGTEMHVSDPRLQALWLRKALSNALHRGSVVHGSSSNRQLTANGGSVDQSHHRPTCSFD
mmetsp:Transcript_62397/g.103793  ORF Transcript_62397/g.103793 Transcript_62397/m.103793 type:complete len:413 (+) Transcript_62397:163-1401(+)|eukprot:CAMPEP_0119342282 /NCGR_PEP_ID=MMETSP1333-20130426/104372_1 /TAXON_ID=418940 /ORGANISM="Scyphosphaera apsteinii, Strain RCC1455" /LENGTH=412 /DNA_ID=CAMNT_0007354467 /DNA_START=163 /DNA_END=1401 /DNA_ORIENTATION=-